MSIHQKVFLHKDKIEIEDARFYRATNPETKEESFVPSVTTVLSAWPKGFGFTEWLKSNGFNADEIADRTAKKGTNIHQACEMLLLGLEVSFFKENMEEHTEENAGTNYTWDEWQQIAKFAEFCDVVDFDLLGTPETRLVSWERQVGGTLDIPAIQIRSWLCLLDIKTGNNLHRSQEIQLAKYAQMWNDVNPDRQIEKCGILWLNAKTRTQKIDYEKGVFQGVGWQVKFVEDVDFCLELFDHAQAIFNASELGSAKPKVDQMPATFKLKTKEEKEAEAKEAKALAEKEAIQEAEAKAKGGSNGNS